MFLYSSWRSIPLSTRQKIAAVFDIKKSLPTHVVNNVVENDGYQIAEIEGKLTVRAIEEFVGATKEMPMEELWQMLVDKAEGRGVQVMDSKVSIPADEIKKELDAVVFPPATPTPAKRGRKPRAK